MAGNKVSLDEMKRILNIEKVEEPKEVIGQADVDDDGKVNIYNTTLKALGKEVTDYAVENLKPELTEVVAKLTDESFEALDAKLQREVNKTSLELKALAEQVRPIEVKTPGKSKILKGVRHNQFDNLLKIVGSGLAVLLVGPAGTGKSHAAEVIADALDLTFYMISVGSQTSKSDLIGYMTADGRCIRTQFREAYEHGGLFLLDEADAGNSNVLILLNAALSNGHMAFPDGMVKVHPNFRMVAAANTYGNGASRQYVGRNQLDAATLDRFATLEWNIDDKIEEALAGTTADGKRWLLVVRAVRKRVADELDLRVVISPRATLRGATLLAAGMPFEDVMKTALTGNIPSSSRSEMENLAKATWGR